MEAQEGPTRCPICCSSLIRPNLVEWSLQSIDDPDNQCTVFEHQCQSCGASFWC